MKISRVYCVAAVTVGVISMALGTSSPNLAVRRATAPAPAAAVMSSFDTCLVDAAGNQLIWNSTTGAYRSTRASDGFLLTGTGVVGLVNGIRTLTDFKTDRRLSAGFNTGQLTGSATIYLMVAQGVWQVVRIIDNNPSATCTLPPVITSFSSDVGFCPGVVLPTTPSLTWTTSNATSVTLVYTSVLINDSCHFLPSPSSNGPRAPSGSATLDTLFRTLFIITCGDSVTLTATGPGGSVSQTINIHN